MKNSKKLSLNTLKVKSFVTTLEEKQMETAKGQGTGLGSLTCSIVDCIIDSVNAVTIVLNCKGGETNTCGQSVGGCSGSATGQGAECSPEH